MVPQRARAQIARHAVLLALALSLSLVPALERASAQEGAGYHARARERRELVAPAVDPRYESTQGRPTAAELAGAKTDLGPLVAGEGGAAEPLAGLPVDHLEGLSAEVPWLLDQEHAPGVRLEAFKLYSQSRLPDLAQLTPDLVTYATAVHWPLADGTMAWAELAAFNASVQPAYTRFDGATYSRGFGARVHARLAVPRDRTYTMYLSVAADAGGGELGDAARLWIDGAEVVRVGAGADSDASSASSPPGSGTRVADGVATAWAHVRLHEGERTLRVEYTHNDGPSALTLEYSRPGVRRRTLGGEGTGELGAALLLPVPSRSCAALCGADLCVGGVEEDDAACWRGPVHAPRLPPSPGGANAAQLAQAMHAHNPHPYVTAYAGAAGYHLPTNVTAYYEVFHRVSPPEFRYQLAAKEDAEAKYAVRSSLREEL